MKKQLLNAASRLVSAIKSCSPAGRAGREQNLSEINKKNVELNDFHANLTFYIHHKYFNRVIHHHLTDSLAEQRADKVNLVFDEVEKDPAFYQRFIDILKPVIYTDVTHKTLVHFIDDDNPAFTALVERLVNKGQAPLTLKKIVQSNRIDLIEITQPIHHHYAGEIEGVTTTALWNATPQMFNALQQYKLLQTSEGGAHAKNLWTLISRLDDGATEIGPGWDVMEKAFQSNLLTYDPTIAFQGKTELLLEQLSKESRISKALMAMFNLTSTQLKGDVLCEYIENEMEGPEEVKRIIEKTLPGALTVPTPYEYRDVLLKIVNSLNAADLMNLASEIQSNSLRETSFDTRRNRIRI